jgi:Berberine and berberine like
LNFTGIADEPLDAGVGAAFGRNLGRLRQIKKTYDPGNFFRLNNNVLPSG